MAVCMTNRSNALTNSSVAFLERAVCSGSFLRDISREDEFNRDLKEALHLDLPEDERAWALEEWTDFYNFMPNEGGGIICHINTLMKQEHARLLEDWKKVDTYAHQMERLIGNIQRFRILCKDFRIQDREYDCLTSNFLVEKPHGLRMHEHPFFMTARMMRKLRICQVAYQVIELSDKYELLENFFLHADGHFDETFKLGSTEVRVRSIKNPPMFLRETVNIEVDGISTRVVSCKSHGKVENIDEIKFVDRVLSCLKHMSNYKDDEAQFGVIDNLYKVGCDNFIVAKSPTIHQILHMQPPNDLVLVDLSQVSDIPLIFGGDFTTIDAYVDEFS
jgi:hypothetical protein